MEETYLAYLYDERFNGCDLRLKLRLGGTQHGGKSKSFW